MKALLLATAVSVAAFSLPGGALATPIDTTTIDFRYFDGATVVATGSFSYAEGASGVLSYTDLTEFSVTLFGVTYVLADVLPLNHYVWFGYDTGSNSFAPSPCGCDYPASLSALNYPGTYGFFFNTAPGSFVEYSTGYSGHIDAIELTLAAVPEPASLALLGAGLLGLGVIRRRAAR